MKWFLGAIAVVIAVAIEGALLSAAFLVGYVLAPRDVVYVPNDSPEAAARNLCVALFYGDEDGVKLACLRQEVSHDLLACRSFLFRMSKIPIELARYDRLKPGGTYLHNGRRMQIPLDEWSENRAVVLMDLGDPENMMPFSLVRLDGKWQVDPAPLLRGLAAAAKVKAGQD